MFTMLLKLAILVVGFVFVASMAYMISMPFFDFLHPAGAEESKQEDNVDFLLRTIAIQISSMQLTFTFLVIAIAIFGIYGVDRLEKRIKKDVDDAVKKRLMQSVTKSKTADLDDEEADLKEVETGPEVD